MHILIVDDEYYIVQGIIEGIEWDSLGIDKISSAFSMSQAQEIFRSQTVDLLLTDIEMPQGDGLDLIRWAAENGYSPLSIILTGHQLFDYAQEAVNLHCFGYILKPVSLPKLTKELQNAVSLHAKLQKEQPVESSDFLTSVQKYIAQNLRSPELNRTLIASTFFMNPEYLSYLFHKKSGQSLNSYILGERLALAQKLLVTSHMSLQEISSCVGFSSTQYFHKQFKKEIGMTPQQYRLSAVDEPAKET